MCWLSEEQEGQIEGESVLLNSAVLHALQEDMAPSAGVRQMI